MIPNLIFLSPLSARNPLPETDHHWLGARPLDLVRLVVPIHLASKPVDRGRDDFSRVELQLATAIELLDELDRGDEFEIEEIENALFIWRIPLLGFVD